MLPVHNVSDFMKHLAFHKIISLDGIANRMISYYNAKHSCFVYVGNFIDTSDKKPRSKKEPNCVNFSVKWEDLVYKEDEGPGQ